MENGREREEIENELTLQDFQPFVSPPDFAISLSPIHLPGEIYIYIYLYTRVGDKMETKGEEPLHSDDAVANLYFRLSLKRDKLIKVIHGGAR